MITLLIAIVIICTVFCVGDIIASYVSDKMFVASQTIDAILEEEI